MTEHATLAYAHRSVDTAADRLLRLGVAWYAVATGGCSIASTALGVALSQGWLATPNTMSWSTGGGVQMAATAVNTVIVCVMLLGGLLLLRRSPASFIVLRSAIVCYFVMTLAGHVILLWFTPSMASYYSTPATMAAYATSALAGLLHIALFGLLTLPPLSARMLPPA